jgi:hypothetical protein
MTTLHLPQPDNDATDIDDVHRACANYCEHLQRAVSIDAASQRIVAIAGDNLDAITMPAELGRRVWTVLAADMPAGPTIVGPGPSRWTILTQRVGRDRLSCPARLHDARVTLVPRGAQIILPSPRDTTQTYLWIEAPRPFLQLPMWSRVMTMASQIVAGRSVDERAS